MKQEYNNKMPKERLNYIDLGAGIMILWMIVGHAVCAASLTELCALDIYGTHLSALPEGVHARIDAAGNVNMIYLTYYIPNFLFFFLQWFCYKSGQFFRKRSIKDNWKRDWSKLMKPFLIWSAIGWVCYLAFLGIDGGLTLRKATYSVVRSMFFNGWMPINIPLWFMFTLFGMRQIANVVLPQKGDKYYWLKCTSVILISFGIAFGAWWFQWPMLPKWVANMASGLAFFTLGYCLSRYETKLWMLIPCVVFYGVCWALGFPVLNMIDNACKSAPAYLISLPACFAGIVSFNAICRVIAQHLPRLSAPFEFVGQWAMVIYVSHGLFSEGIPHALLSFYLKPLLTYTNTFWIVMGCYVLFVPFFCWLSTKTSKSPVPVGK